MNFSWKKNHQMRESLRNKTSQNNIRSTLSGNQNMRNLPQYNILKEIPNVKFVVPEKNPSNFIYYFKINKQKKKLRKWTFRSTFPLISCPPKQLFTHCYSLSLSSTVCFDAVKELQKCTEFGLCDIELKMVPTREPRLRGEGCLAGL